MRRLRARDARVLEDASEHERALRRPVAAITDDAIRARLAEGPVHSTSRIAGQTGGKGA